MASVIDVHPERQKIIDGILSGKTLRDIAKSVTPPVSPMAVQRYRIKQAAKIGNRLRVSTSTPEAGLELARVQAVTRAAEPDPFVARVTELRAAREKVKDLALAGERPDLRAWSALDRNDLSELELHARLAGRLDSGATGAQVAIQIVCPAGGSPEVTARGTDGVTLDISPAK